jgi:hypothetical protein
MPAAHNGLIVGSNPTAPTIFEVNMKDIDKKKWGKRAAFFAVFGITGLAAIAAINTYRSLKGLDDIDWDNLKL